MRNKLRSFLPVFLTFSIICCSAFPGAFVYAEENPDPAAEEESYDPPAEEESLVFNVVDFGAVSGDDVNNGSLNTNAFKNALGQAKYHEEPITVVIPKGVWHLSGALRMYSDTILLADKEAEIIADYYEEGGTMLSAFHLNDAMNNCRGETCKHGGYSQARNITIEGGIWSWTNKIPTGKATAMSILRIRHSENITIRNMVCKQASSHFFNLASARNVRVENVSFLDSQYVTSKTSSFWGSDGHKYGNMNAYNAMEAVHLDICDGKGESGPQAMPLDCTPCANVTVTNCIFRNIWSGVGNHHMAQKSRTSGIRVTNNTFSNMRWYGVNALDFDYLTVQGNTLTNTLGIANLGTCVGATVTNNRYSRVASNGASKFKPSMANPAITIANANIKGTTNVSNNIIANKAVKITRKSVPVLHKEGIVVSNSKSVNVCNNRITNYEGEGIALYFSKSTLVLNNTITGTAGSALSLQGFKGYVCKATVKNNTLSSATVLRKGSKKGYDLMLGGYAKKCNFSGNKLKHYSFYREPGTSSYTGKLKLPKLRGKRVKLSKTVFSYSGKRIKPKVIVRDNFGRKLTRGVHYKLVYKKNRKVGKAVVYIKGMETFAGQVVKKTFWIM